jgi:sulfur-carrier protein adenylyltransferase/sulfurtransferase
MNVKQISVSELKERIDQGTKPFLLDVRESHERDICKLEDDLHMPMREIPQRWIELKSDQETVVYCRSGQRSAQVCGFLVQNGFTNVANLQGGILAWATYVDPTMRKY